MPPTAIKNRSCDFDSPQMINHLESLVNINFRILEIHQIVKLMFNEKLAKLSFERIDHTSIHGLQIVGSIWRQKLHNCNLQLRLYIAVLVT
jgi:hypothetical protein